jgi:sec-independent protein translocase protein TatA
LLKGVIILPHIGTLELIIVLVIVILLFGAGRIVKTAGELGEGLRAFRNNLSGKKEGDSKKEK